MSMLNTNDRYGTLSLVMHWLTALLMVGVYLLINLHDWLGRTSTARAMEEWHATVGVLILLLSIARLPLRLLQSTPAIKPPLVQWQHQLSILFHVALYALMLSMPVIGWLLFSAEGHTVSMFGIALPALTAQDRAFAEQMKEVHEVIGNLGYLLIAVHTAAALFHHHVQRDNTLRRMLPG